MKKNNPSTSRFQFEGYIIDKASIALKNKNVGTEMEFRIEPNAQVANDKMNLTLEVEVNDKEQNLMLNLRVVGFFRYDGEQVKEINQFLYLNGPAILFPYVRSYVSNITALSGLPPIIMPTLNMQPVGEYLRSKMTKQE